MRSAQMKMFLLMCVQTAVSSPISTADQAQGFLERYGYLQKEETHHNAEVKSAIREFQWLSQLSVTGRLDRATMEKMSSARCGVKDVGSHSSWSRRINRIFTGHLGRHGRHEQHLRKKRYTHIGEKWHKRQLTYGIMNCPRSLSPGQVRVAVNAAFQLWSNVSGLLFQELQQGPTDITLAFFEGEHNDGTGNAFDGPGGTLAHAFFPFRGEAHFDMSERWTLSGLKGHNLFLVTAHEIGHTLGLVHSPVRHALMSPYYKKMGSAALLSWDDIAAIQQLYGQPPGDTVKPLAGRALRWAMQDWQIPQDPMGGSLIPHYCQGFFDAITMDENGTVLVFQGHHFWTVSYGSVSDPLPLQTRWPQLPLAIEAAAFSTFDSKLYFFKGRRVWRYSGSDLDPGFPRRNSKLGLPSHPDCAFFYQPLGHMVLFKGSRYFVLNLESLRIEPYYPRALRDWKGIPRGANGALTRPDGKLYFFKERQYWRFDPGKLSITATGQWEERLPWIGCHTTPS
ncbi:matrix metalloproteinase-28 [Rhinichthys klamathensis goyatoka]|uniref:matrix metalloproteinase-28 n=1 Tax=Rhinichthys klamathensis goyatoka TaxID=3034132 RepID=UPI0024B62621|nr:matrix metalloproteinase-28 [Rhinichthys klamathensis goyatoka]